MTEPRAAQPADPVGNRAASRIRLKLVLLHTLFSLVLGVVVVVAAGAVVGGLVRRAEAREARLALGLVGASALDDEQAIVAGIDVLRGGADDLDVDTTLCDLARSAGGAGVDGRTRAGRAIALRAVEEGGFLGVTVDGSTARGAVGRGYVLLILSLVAIYGLIALTLEVFVLPGQVYQPIERLRRADAAVQAGRRSEELIEESQIPRDELGDIMRSRNRSILKLRAQERALNAALDEVERAASELKRKNHLLEAARRNLADQDRLASLGMMSAGIAHELNTPLAVLKGSVERLAETMPPGDPHTDRIALLRRVGGRLERLGESLLDFARTRPPSMASVSPAALLDEAWTLVSLDRDARGAVFRNEVDPELHLPGDPDRLTQVFVNLLRNAVDASEGEGEVHATAELAERDGRGWVSVRIVDDGPGIDPAMLPRLFEPFASTRLDSHGTGLGLAVAEGIVREHDGVLLARNQSPPGRGAIFEVMLPATLSITDPEPNGEPPRGASEGRG